MAQLFQLCRATPSLRHQKLEGIALGTKLVQLFTNFVCLKIPELTCEESLELLTSLEILAFSWLM